MPAPQLSQGACFVNLFRLAFRLLLGKRLPITQGTLSVPGLHGTVRIHRDRHGIPLIEAGNDDDAHFAVGFCHGQDRSFQLELLLRVARGTLSGMVGPRGLPVDRLSRRIGFIRAATAQEPFLHADVRAALEAYARGVNAGHSVGSPSRPHELALLRAEPTPWTARDTLAFTKLLSFTLCANWDSELVRLKVLSTDGPEALRALDGAYPEWQPVIRATAQAATPAVNRLADDLQEFFAVMPPRGGSNNWVVSGSRTATGRPILANDPHLDASLPSHWYFAAVRTPRWANAGATFIGGPTILVGHNGTACWGLTAGLVDNTDLFIEEVGPDSASVRQGTGFRPCEVVEEVIPVKGAAPVTERVLITPRGPIISPALVETAEALSMRAAWLDPVPITGLFRVGQVQSFAEFRAAFEHWPAASQNMVYADTSGKIGWQLIGRAPVRRKGFGTIPLPGWDESAGWESDAVPFEEMPYVEDPPSGFVATANNRHQLEGPEPFLGVDFTDGYRAAAIEEALAARTDWDVAETMRLQMDQHARAWTEMREFVLAAPASDPDSALALELLRDWDGRVVADSPAAAVYELFLAEMIVRVARARAPRSWRWVVGAGLSPLTPYNFGSYRRTGHLVRLLREQPAGWFARTWPEELASALAQAVQRLAKQTTSKDPSRWAWGAVRVLVMHHPMARAGALGKALGRVFNLGPVPCGADADVINQAAVLPYAPLAPADNMPSLRAVFDVGAWQNSRFVLPGGQSGNPLSPHYGDLFELWQRGEGLPIAFTAEEMKAAAVQALDLRPAPEVS
jgi:penicillin amidase